MEQQSLIRMQTALRLIFHGASFFYDMAHIPAGVIRVWTGDKFETKVSFTVLEAKEFSRLFADQYRNMKALPFHIFRKDLRKDLPPWANVIRVEFLLSGGVDE